MDNKSYPPPASPPDVPDYYLGMLINFEPLSNDNCHWVVYDGHSKVRCVSRQSAVAYINERRRLTTSDSIRLAALARYYVNKASNLLEQAARLSNPDDRLILDYLAVQLRPMIVNIDNYLTTSNHDKLSDQKDQHQTTE